MEILPRFGTVSAGKALGAHAAAAGKFQALFVLPCNELSLFGVFGLEYTPIGATLSACLLACLLACELYQTFQNANVRDFWRSTTVSDILDLKFCPVSPTEYGALWGLSGVSTGDMDKFQFRGLPRSGEAFPP